MQRKKRGRFSVNTKSPERSYAWFRFERKPFNDLSEFEDQKDRSFLKEIGIQAATNAVNENRAMGIPTTFLQDGWVVSRMPNGQIEQISQLEPGAMHKRKFKKGTVLHVKKPTH